MKKFYNLGARKPTQPRLGFGLEKLREIACTLQTIISGKFTSSRNDDIDIDIDTMIITYNTTIVNAASQILGKERHRRKPWIIRDVLSGEI